MITETRKGIPALGALTLFTALSGEFWPNLLGVSGAVIFWAALSAVLAVATTRLGGWTKLRLSLVPKSLAAFVLLAVLSIAWATDRGIAAWTAAALLALTLGGIFLATTFSWPALLAMLGRTTRLIVGLSLVFELVTAIFVRQRIGPFAGLSSSSEISRSNLFTGDAILGVVGNADAVGSVAALGLIIVLLERASGTVSRRRLLCWTILFGSALVLSASWTGAAALGLTGLAWAGLLLARSRAEGHRGSPAIGLAIAAVAALTVLLLTTGRWLELPSGLGAMSPVGIVLLLGILISTTYRSWWLAADCQRDATGTPLPYSASTLLPLLITVFVTVFLAASLSTDLSQAFAVSWSLLVVVSVKSKQDAHSVALALAEASGRYRDLPLRGFPRVDQEPAPLE